MRIRNENRVMMSDVTPSETCVDAASAAMPSQSRIIDGADETAEESMIESDRLAAIEASIFRPTPESYMKLLISS